MAGCLIETGDESVTVSGAAAKRLLERGDGDAALLYLALLRRRGAVPPRSLAGELRWDRSRIEAAETALRQMGLVSAAEPPPEPAEEKPDYQRADVAEHLERSEEFRALTDQVERKLGKKLTTPDVAVLLGLTDYLGLPADVVYLLVCHCVERVRRRAIQRFEEDRQERENRFQQRRESIFRRQPRLREIDAELRATASHIITSALRQGTDPLPALKVIRDENLSLQEEKGRLLEKMNLPRDCLEEKPACALCGDTGYRGGASLPGKTWSGSAVSASATRSSLPHPAAEISC